MLTYNTRLKRLILPEYGRNIQNMVNHCLSLEDRGERTSCAYSIIRAMETLFPAEGDPEDYRRKLWDHLAIMSDFKLDIDWPFPVIQSEQLQSQPKPIINDVADIRFKQYGKNLEAMIQVASQMPDSPERQALALLIANQMKKDSLAVNPEGADDQRIFNDLRMLSHGAISLNAEETRLHEYKAMPAPSKKKKKK
ncbi:MAG: DUF4290 domain-containing protein [Clostridium sp.]|nr:DUF4290 domain-containing protein [Clostridium sp.]